MHPVAPGRFPSWACALYNGDVPDCTRQTERSTHRGPGASRVEDRLQQAEHRPIRNSMPFLAIRPAPRRSPRRQSTPRKATVVRVDASPTRFSRDAPVCATVGTPAPALVDVTSTAISTVIVIVIVKDSAEGVLAPCAAAAACQGVGHWQRHRRRDPTGSARG